MKARSDDGDVEKNFGGDLIKNQLEDGNMDLCRIDPVHQAILVEEQFRYLNIWKHTSLLIVND